MTVHAPNDETANWDGRTEDEVRIVGAFATALGGPQQLTEL